MELSEQQIKAILPSNLRSGISTELVQTINDVLADEGMATGIY